MGLHSLSIPGLGQDLKELVVGEEVETRKGRSLGLQVVFQAFLDLVQRLVVVLELAKERLALAYICHK